MASYSSARRSSSRSSHGYISRRNIMALESPGPTINLCLLLPKAPAPDGEISPDLSNWVWVHVLVLPVDKLATLSFILKPYKWIRFVAGAILAVHGNLSWSPNSTDPPVDYDAPLPTESQTVYFHCDEVRENIFPVDPHMIEDDPDVFTCDPQFRFEVEERDGGKCVVTGCPPIECRAVHIVPSYHGNAVSSVPFIVRYAHVSLSIPDRSVYTEIDQSACRRRAWGCQRDRRRAQWRFYYLQSQVRLGLHVRVYEGMWFAQWPVLA